MSCCYSLKVWKDWLGGYMAKKKTETGKKATPAKKTPSARKPQVSRRPTTGARASPKDAEQNKGTVLFIASVAYGKEKIIKNFKEANIAFVADILIVGATRQILRWLNKVQRMVSFIPGAKTVMSFANLIISTALNYIDEAVLSYVFYHDEEKNGFKKACDGLVYYAQSWKGMLKSALKVAAFVWIFRIAIILIFYAVFMALGQVMLSSLAANIIGNVFGVLLALIILYGVEAIVVVPYATCVMINDYYKAIAGERLRSDLHGTLCKVSRKFRELFSKSGRPMPAEPAKAPTPL